MSSLDNFLNSDHFIVLGGHKCATSSLHAYLKQHPEIAMPRTKGRDILNRPNLAIEDYQKSYDPLTSERVFGEVSSTYWRSEIAYLAIEKYFPKAKLIFVLRHPADRAFSHFNFLSQEHNRTVKFKDICQNPANFLGKSGRKIITNGLYYSHLKRYLNRFGREQICVLLFDTLTKSKKEFFSTLFKFIEVQDDFLPNTSFIVRKGGKVISPKNNKLLSENSFLRHTIRGLIRPFTTVEQRYFLGKRLQNLLVRPESMNQESRDSLTNFYREDIVKVQDLLELDLSHWLK